MNSLERILIEKAGREHGFEYVLPVDDDAVCLGSARHRAQVRFTAKSIDILTQLLSRAAALAQSLPNQAELDYQAEVQKKTDPVAAQRHRSRMHGPTAHRAKRLLQGDAGFLRECMFGDRHCRARSLARQSCYTLGRL
ncbi:hypothetical protein [Methylotuvimicrobium buryatense]|uniref:Uncharacterized protein n=1 Tax=Methylotuvimicrobium buryatense TaxID=95641 RepID=A0A4P9URY8_METBY|nr:hypothetical protein [Methylotuvimicrobium buryatense]QCW82456.1 hypothetical protein EQU24_09540 [Methylotuvimicrobium buryatense]